MNSAIRSQTFWQASVMPNASPRPACSARRPIERDRGGRSIIGVTSAPAFLIAEARAQIGTLSLQARTMSARRCHCQSAEVRDAVDWELRNAADRRGDNRKGRAFKQDGCDLRML